MGAGAERSGEVLKSGEDTPRRTGGGVGASIGRTSDGTRFEPAIYANVESRRCMGSIRGSADALSGKDTPPRQHGEVPVIAIAESQRPPTS